LKNVGITKLSVIRRVVMLGILSVFLLQFFRIDAFIGGLSGADIFGIIKMLDVFAFIETVLASMSVTWAVTQSVLVVVLIYLLFGRSFCGWVCPYDLLFSWVQKLRRRVFRKKRNKPVASERARKLHNAGYILIGLLLIVSIIIGIPFFTKYFSHLTNFFRMISTGVYYSSDVPVSVYMLIISTGIVAAFIIMESFFPRYWCRYFCPVGKVYGGFNKVSVIKLRFKDMENCTQCYLCQSSCYMDVPLSEYIDIMKEKDVKTATLRSTDCIYCGLCVEHCGTQSNITISLK